MYDPVDSSRREIRLLQLVGGSDDGPIQCQLRTVRLDDADLRFAALSYVWGDESITRDVLVGGHPRAVTTNLESALRNFWHYFTENGVSVSRRYLLISSMMGEPNGITGLRRVLSSEDCELHHESDADEGTDSEEICGADGISHKVKDISFIARIATAFHRARVGGGYLPIWVDALCINQGHPVEKSQQIAMMRDIFAKARCVFSWLGPLSTIRKLAGCVRDGYSISQLKQDCPELCARRSDVPRSDSFNNKYWEAISSFAEAEYFERLWIFQELWAAAPVRVIFLCGDEHLPMESLVRYRAWAHSVRTLTSDHPPYSGHLIPTVFLLDQIDSIKTGHILKAGAATRLFLAIVCRSRCKNPRDKVFALFGIFRMDLTPDYTMSVADVYEAWAANSHQDLALGSLIFYSGIGLYPETLGAHNLASWQPDLERLGDQTGSWDSLSEHKHSNPETPAKYKPTILPTRCFSCFGIQVAQVGKVASQAGKKTVDYTNLTKGMMKRYEFHGIWMIPLLKYLVDNKDRFWTHAYHERGSPLRALVETVDECIVLGKERVPTSRLSGETLREFTPYNLFRKVLLLRKGPRNFTFDELKFFGFQSEEKLWECLAGISSNLKDDDGFNLATEPGEGNEDAFVEFVHQLFIFSFHKNLFHTVDGRVGGGPPGTETHDLVYSIHGCSRPVLLREVEGRLRHVGVCYIPGLSGVDAFQILKERDSDVRQLSLV